MDTTLAAHPPHGSVIERLAFLGACATAAAVFSTVGWIAMAPDDPLGAVSLLSHPNPVAMYLQGFALFLLAACAGTVLAGHWLPDIGTFAACVGLLTVSFRGATGERLLMESAGVSHSMFGLKLLMEAAAWIPVCGGSILFTAIILRWHRPFAGNKRAPNGYPPTWLVRNAGTQFPRLSQRWFGVDDDTHEDRKYGLMHAGLVFSVTVILAILFAGGFGSRAAQHGQSCFVVAAAVAIGAYFGHRVYPVRSAFWTLVGFWAASLACYLWGTFRPGTEGLPIALSFHPTLRILPIQFVASGTASAILMFWNLTGEQDERLHHPAPRKHDKRNADTAALPGPATKKKRKKRK